MEPTALRQLLQELCDDLDRGQPVSRWRSALGGGLVLAGLASGLQACDEEATPVYGAPAPWEEDCADGQDDDGDGDVDCEDDDCHAAQGCEDTDGTPAVEEDCDDDVDNDGDGEIDCFDYDCDDDPACVDDALYGVPLVE